MQRNVITCFENGGSFSRRRFVGALGAGSAVALGGCATSETGEPSGGAGLTRATAVDHVADA